MQLQNIRYITGIVKFGARIGGYAIVEPGSDLPKPEIVLLRDMKTYMLKHKCMIVNATIDSFGQAHFKTKTDEQSYVLLNTSGVAIGFEGKKGKPLHRGNKDGDGPDARPTTSYIVVDSGPEVSKVMNVRGTVKGMRTADLINYAQNGLIISNAELKNGQIVLINQGLDELTIGKTAPTAPIAQQNVAKPVVPPVAPISPAAPLKPPTFTKPVQPPVQKTEQPKPVQQPQKSVTAIPPAPQVSKPAQLPGIIDFSQKVHEGYDFGQQFLKDYADRQVEIKLNVKDLNDYQFNIIDVKGYKLLTYNEQADRECPYHLSEIYDELQKFIQLLSDEDARTMLNKVTVSLYLDNTKVNGVASCLLYREECFVNFTYVLDWEHLDLVELHEKHPVRFRDKALNPNITLLYLPNMTFNISTKELVPTDAPTGTFMCYHQEAYNRVRIYDDMGQLARKHDLVVTTHPRTSYSEIRENMLHFYFDYSFGKVENAKNLIIDLSKTRIRFLATNALHLQYASNYILRLPDTCVRVHKEAIMTLARTSNPTVTYAISREYFGYDHGQVDAASLNDCVRVHIVSNVINRIDEACSVYSANKTSGSRTLISLSDWSNITSLTKTGIDITELPKVHKPVNLKPFIPMLATASDAEATIENWYGIGTWSDIGKGKLSVSLSHRMLPSDEPVNLYISGTVKKVNIELITEYVKFGWPKIGTIYVEPGVEEVTIFCCTLKYQERARRGIAWTFGDTSTDIDYLILPESIKRFSATVTATKHDKYLKRICIPKHSLVARLNIEDELYRHGIKYKDIIKYDNEQVVHGKNMLSDLLGTDMSQLPLIDFDVTTVKRNLELAGIKF